MSTGWQDTETSYGETEEPNGQQTNQDSDQLYAHLTKSKPDKASKPMPCPGNVNRLMSKTMAKKHWLLGPCILWLMLIACKLKSLLVFTLILPFVIPLNLASFHSATTMTWKMKGSYPDTWLILSALMLHPHFISIVVSSVFNHTFLFCPQFINVAVLGNQKVWFPQ